MISDVLSEAVGEIDSYVADDFYPKRHKPEILAVRAAMRRLHVKLDHASVEHDPTPEEIDRIVAELDRRHEDDDSDMIPDPVHQGPLPHWSDRLAEAQQFTHRVIEGRKLPRIRFGDELPGDLDYPPVCHDCDAALGQYHVDGCDVERCPACNGQFICCECGKSCA